MKFCMVNKRAFVNRFVVHTLHRKITHSSIITCKTFEKMEKLKCVRRGEGGGGVEKSKRAKKTSNL